LLGQAAIGDFDGDRRADVFYTDGREWLVSYGGTGFFTHYAYAIHRVPDLRFGDFNNDRKTDVFGVVGDQRMVVRGGTQFWAPLRAKLTNSVEGLTVADFNGEGRADVGASSRWITGGYIWRVSFSGTDNWATLRTNSPSLSSVPAIGNFDGGARRRCSHLGAWRQRLFWFQRPRHCIWRGRAFTATQPPGYAMTKKRLAMKHNKKDIVAFGDDGVWVARSTGSGFEAAQFVLAAFGYNQGWRVGKHPRFVNAGRRQDAVTQRANLARAPASWPTSTGTATRTS